MSKHTHTPGPWVARNATLPNSNVIRWVILETEAGFTLADTGNADTPKHQDEANARLIAASPTMLEALKDVLGGLNARQKNTGEPDDLIRVVIKAIAKAEGSENE